MAVQELDKSRPEKLLYMQIADRIRDAVRMRKYDTGQKLPSLQQLSSEFGVNHLTVRRGIESLQKEGVLDVRPRVGVFVAERRQDPRRAPRLVLAVRSYLQSSNGPHPAVAAYLAGMHAHARAGEIAYQTVFYRKGMLTKEWGQSLLAHQADGIIISDGGTITEDYEFLRQHRIAVVDCSLAPVADASVFRLVRVLSDVVRLGVEHLRSLGHRRIAFLCWEHPGDMHQASSAFTKLVVDHQLGNPRELLVEIENPEHNPRWDQIEKLFDMHPLPTAVIVHDDGMGDHLLAACLRRGIRVPEDLSIVSLVDSNPNGHRVPMTAPDTVAQSISMMRLAVDKLLDQIEGRALPEAVIEVPANLMMKASTGPVFKK